MDGLASGVTKAITEYLHQNEKRQTAQQTTSETHEKLLESLQGSIKNLEIKCEELTKENASLKEELRNREKRDEQTEKDINKTKLDADKLQARLGELEKWPELIAAVVEKIKSLEEFRVIANDQLEKINENQYEFAKQIKRQQSANTPYRIPVKSPSASSYLNGNTHSSLPRPKQAFHKNNLLIESVDHDDDDMSSVSEQAERLKRELVHLSRSFEDSSFY